MIVSLEEVKQYLRVDGDEEDTLITNFILSAQEICEDVLRIQLSELDPIPEVIKQAILYTVAQFYELRENTDIQKIIEMVRRLLFAYRKEAW